MANDIENLRSLLASGKFHHATYRDRGTCWEGLRIYQKASAGEGWHGYELAPCFFGKDDPDLDAAFELCHGKGISVGAYGGG